MTYRLKKIRYQVRSRSLLGSKQHECVQLNVIDICYFFFASSNTYCYAFLLQKRDVRILLQNENGPCPLLAAANALLLKGSVVLPAHAIRNDVASLDDVANMLANHAMLEHNKKATDQQQQHDEDHSFHINELMQYVPRFQYGMDVNPKFTDCLAYEYTPEVTVFDMLSCGRLVHGWLVDPIHAQATAAAVGTKTYNELMDQIIAGQEAESQLSKLQADTEQLKLSNPQLMDESSTAIDLLDDGPEAVASVNAHRQLAQLQKKQADLQEAATNGHLIQHFFHESSHQLTVFGLEQLHQTLADDEL